MCLDGREALFTKQDTQILKGMAVFLLLIHHSWDRLTASQTGWLHHAVSLGKITVAIFVILSGYGMYVSFLEKSRHGLSIWRFALSHILQVYAVFVLCALVQIAIVSLQKGGLQEIYGKYPTYYLLLDLMALSYPLGSPKFVGSWWYMTAVLVYYAVFPLLYALVQRLGRLTLVPAAAMALGVLWFPQMNPVFLYGVFFFLGMTVARLGLLEWFLRKVQGSARNFWLCEMLCAAGLLGFLLFRQYFLDGRASWYHMDWLGALLLIFLTAGAQNSLSRLPAGQKWHGGLFRLTGSYSFEIYLVHGAFIVYGESWLYRSASPLAVLLQVYLLSLLAAVLLRRAEKLLRIPRLARWVRNTAKKRVLCVIAGLLAAWLILLPVPKELANLGIGELMPIRQEITIEAGEWYVPLYARTPFLWDLADKRYQTGNAELMIFVDGVIYAKAPGETWAKVSLPSGKSVVFLVTVEAT